MKQLTIITLLALVTFACGNRETKKAETTESASSEPAIDGLKIFTQNCVVCHGNDGKLGLNGSKDITVSALDLNERIALIAKGKGLMTPFENILSLTEIKAVAEYTMTMQ